MSDWKEYWKRRKPGDKRPEPTPFCAIHGCESKAGLTCKRCKSPVCGEHHDYGTCVDCSRDEELRETMPKVADRHRPDDDEPCPMCGGDSSECYCYDIFHNSDD